ncbi:hypothetical protein BJF79_15650 [Actinomadura sp. CNU-125]|nr:hypothetical protein [Actinomadura sp. CNU-125]OLT21221.1 hypothetical protein BJF79_15650 [Actinomadura sp. CNU-125]
MTSETTRASIDVRAPVAAGDAGTVRYPSSVATRRMRSAVSALTRPGRAKARDTVEVATPAAFATS